MIRFYWRIPTCTACFATAIWTAVIGTIPNSGINHSLARIRKISITENKLNFGNTIKIDSKRIGKLTCWIQYPWCCFLNIPYLETKFVLFSHNDSPFLCENENFVPISVFSSGLLTWISANFWFSLFHEHSLVLPK